MSISNHPVEQEELMAYLDGELSAEHAAEAALHIERCGECQKLAAELQEVSRMLMVWQVEVLKADLLDDVTKHLEECGQGGRPKNFMSGERLRIMPAKHRLLWAGGLAAALVIFFALSIPGFLSVRQAVSSKGTRPEASPAPPLRDAVRVPRISTPAARPNKTIPTRSNEFDLNTVDGNLSPDVSPGAGIVASRVGRGALGKLQKDSTEGVDQEEQETSNVPVANGPMVVRTAELEVTTKEFDKARSSVEEILKRRHGYVGELNVRTPTGSARSLTGTLRVPAAQLDATLADLKALGRTEKESQGGEEVTQQYVDLQARLANARHTEQRLTEILRQRTGKLSDVLAVEMQISRVRGEIEQMEAERKSMKNQVDFATLTVTVTEEYKAELKAVPPSTSTQFRNAAVEGYRSLVDGIIAFLLWLLSAGPTLLLWAAILFFPGRMIWKRVRPRFAQKAPEV